MSRTLALFLLAFVLGGCTAAPRKEEAPEPRLSAQVLTADALYGDASRKLRETENACTLVGKPEDAQCARPVPLGTLNYLMTDYYRRFEWPMRGAASGRPKLCVALSGGGIRSAGFSIGVMQGLADLGLDERIDAISATSGGGYALAWVGHAMASKRASSINSLLRNSVELAALDKRVDEQWDSTASRVTTLLLSIPSRIISLYWLTVDQFIKIPLPSVDAPRISYEGMIRDTFMPEKDDFNKRVDDVGFWRAVFPRGTTVEQLATAVEERRMPLPIWTATATDSSPECKAWNLDKHVYEMTPFRQGSHGFGYTNKFYSYGQQLSLLSAVAGAALDTPCLEGWRRILDLAVGRFGSKFPVLYTTPLIVDPKSEPETRVHTFVRLIDGGDAENLAAYPLIRRLCERIVMVDATEDPHLVFKSYHLLKKSLATQGITLVIPKIDALAKKAMTASCEKEHTQAPLCFASRRQPLPVYSGNVGALPYDGSRSDINIQVSYLKLAMDENSIALYPKAVRDYWGSLDLECRKSQQRGCQFPQDLTIDQRYTQERFRAYRELGRYYVSRCLTPTGQLNADCVNP